MANSTVTIKELGFMINDDLTEAYVFCEVGGDSPIGVQGWHHKSFAASKSVIDIINEWIGNGDYLLSGLEAPQH